MYFYYKRNEILIEDSSDSSSSEIELEEENVKLGKNDCERHSDFDETDVEFSEYELDDENRPKAIESSKTVFNLIEKIRKLVNLVRKSGVICDHVFKRINELKIKDAFNFIPDFHVRWNSTYLMIKRLVKLKVIANELTNKPEEINGLTTKQKDKLAQLQLVNSEWSFIEDLNKLLFPFYECTKIISATHYSTLSLSFLAKKMLINFITSPNESDSTKLKNIKDQLKNVVIHHLKDKIDENQESITLIAAFLDPSTFDFLNDNECTIVEKKIIELLQNKTQKTNITSSSSNAPESHNEIKKKRFHSLAKACNYDNENIISSVQIKKLTAREEIATYKAILVKENVTDIGPFWNKHCKNLPLLASLVRKYSIIPASSVASESAFSVANFIQRKERSSLSSKTLKQSIILKYAAQQKFI